MTDLRQAAQQALEALIDAANVLSAPMFADAADALREALEKSEPPPEWEGINNIIAEYGLQAIDFVSDWKAAQRPWQGLTDEDKQTAVWTDGTFGGGALWAQQLLKERNE